MRNTMNKMFSAIIAAVILMSFSFISPLNTSAKEQSISLNGMVYEFEEKSKYEVDESSPTFKSEKTKTLGNLSITGDISNEFVKDNLTAFEISDGTVFSVQYKYDNTLKNAAKTDWHLVEDNDEVVNKVDLGDDVDYGAVILQTSFDGKKWFKAKTYRNISGDITFNEDSGINDIQLVNGCYYRIIVAYKTAKDESKKRSIKNPIIDTEYKKYAEVYGFYAGYKKSDTEVVGKEFNYRDQDYVKSTDKNNYVGSGSIGSKDPHYGWNLGTFCLSGYTDTGDTSDIYLKTVGNRIKLSFKLEQDIKKLNGNNELVIKSDKDGSDGIFQTAKHNMRHGELIIKYTDEKGQSRITEYSNYLEALASPGADTTVKLFEEGDYEVHLDYAIEDQDGINSTTYYRTSFSFKIRNGNCIVYIFDAKTGNELSNGDIAPNGFRIDTAKSRYSKLTMKKEILNNTENGLTADTRFNGVVTDGSVYTDEGIYTITADNRADSKIASDVKTIYVGNNSLLKAYTKHLGSPDYTIDKLNEMKKEGYTITNDGEVMPPADVTTVSVTTKKTTTTVITTTSAVSTDSEETKTQKSIETTSPNNNEKRSSAPLAIGIIIIAVIAGGLGYSTLKKNKKS
ncbi:MAG: hypothetical protein IJK30_01115 [Ruminococcus sp.]|nr:hypothetical protein [Ruminococcus sp.]